MEQLVIILLIALISFVNWLVKKSSELRKARKLEQASAEKGESAREATSSLPKAEREVSMRRFREALGLPEEAPQPMMPKRMEQRIPPPLPVPPAAPPPATTGAPKVPLATSHRAPARQTSPLPRFPHRIGKPPAASTQPAATTSRIRELLESSGGLRDAVVLSEILGVPKSLRKEEISH